MQVGSTNTGKFSMKMFSLSGVHFNNQFAQFAKAPALSKLHNRCTSVSPTVWLKFYSIF